MLKIMGNKKFKKMKLEEDTHFAPSVASKSQGKSMKLPPLANKPSTKKGAVLPQLKKIQTEQ